MLLAGRTLGPSVGTIGLAFGTTGSLLGAVLAPRIARRLGTFLGVRPSLVVAAAGGCLSLFWLLC